MEGLLPVEFLGAALNPAWKGSSLSVYVGGDEFSHCFQSVCLTRRLIESQPQDSGKPERVTTLVSLRLLNAVKRYLDHDFWFDQVNSAMAEFLKRVIIEPLRHFRQFQVRQTRVSLADVQEFVVVF